MGVLTDGPAAPRSRGRDGKKFVDLYHSLDEDDRALIRKWDADPTVTNLEIHRRVAGLFDIGRSTVERGLQQLRDTEWAS